MQTVPVRILGTGKYLPKNAISAADLDARLGLAPGWVLENSGVHTRYFVDSESASHMGAAAARAALAQAGLSLADIDCLVCTSGTWEQAIPCTASLILRALQGDTPVAVPAFDINATCLGFIAGFDLLAPMIANGRYRHVLLVASEVTSVGLDWDVPHTCSIFGDGAAAVVLGPSGTTLSAILAAAMETHAEQAYLCEIKGGGSRVHPRHYTEDTRHDYLFSMDGPAVFRVTQQLLPGFVRRFLETAAVTLSGIKVVIPHQASPTALRLVERKLRMQPGQFYVIAERVGNIVAASIPMALHDAIAEGRLQRGDRCMLLGTSAGFSMGALLFVY